MATIVCLLQNGLATVLRGISSHFHTTMIMHLPRSPILFISAFLGSRSLSTFHFLDQVSRKMRIAPPCFEWIALSFSPTIVSQASAVFGSGPHNRYNQPVKMGKHYGDYNGKIAILQNVGSITANCTKTLVQTYRLLSP